MTTQPNTPQTAYPIAPTHLHQSIHSSIPHHRPTLHLITPYQQSALSVSKSIQSNLCKATRTQSHVETLDLYSALFVSCISGYGLGEHDITASVRGSDQETARVDYAVGEVRKLTRGHPREGRHGCAER